MTFDLVIKGGTLVTARETFGADIGIQGEKIVALGLALQGRQTIDATGKLVLPGAIDPHVHLEMPQGAAISSDDFVTGTIAAACGGTTTIIDFVEPEFDETLQQALGARMALAAGRAVVDFAFHMTLRNADIATLNQIPAMMLAGCPTFKTYTTYEGFFLNDSEMLRVLEAVAEAGGLVTVHAENHHAIEHLKHRFLAAGWTEPRFHPRSRPPATEGEAVERVLALAAVIGCPLYIVHVSTALGAMAVRRARARGQVAFGETCPQYLLLTDEEYERPGFEGAKFICSPPLRPGENTPILWEQLATDGLQTVGTDHCPFFYDGQKDQGRATFSEIPNGLPGIEARLALLHTFGVRQGRLSLCRWIEVCCAAPAMIFGLYPQKGCLAPGADADIVIFDTERVVTLSRKFLHENVDYTPYEGFQLRGYPEATILRGQVICQNSEFVGSPGYGQFLKRRRHRVAA